MTQQSASPYELHAHGGGGFVSFETDETVALPLFSLGHAVLRGNGETLVSLEFAHHRVVLEGQKLGELFAHLLAGRVRLIRRGRHAECAVDKIQILEQ
jgi:hypothetical protein